MFFEDSEPCTETVAAKVPESVARKLETLARQSRRTKSQCVRLLIEGATVADVTPRRATVGDNRA